ncbi:DUF4238 domain-containing protein [Aureispira sp. CCB-E]|uniref:DUF4238 domain-containing protein n=1 Tax=Aureispira sp. CCB-E TaxID=3051121 RepID=UPI002868AF0C|nr:DUF4238 domain-containing protein [Aureispira sp. CCB-E]WMX17066.1 DUF4238 domain-containing protein [Aureispira sp. CCB-E]
MGKGTIRQHFVPRTYLKNFGIVGKKKVQVYVYDKENERNFLTNTAKIAVQKHFYSLEGKTIEEQQMIEKFYADNIESDYEEVYELLTDASKIQITDDEKYKIVTTILSIYYRNPIWVNKHNEVWKSALTESYRLLENSKEKKIQLPDGEFVDCENKSLEDVIEEVRQKHHQAYLLEHLKYTFMLVNARLDDSITVIKLSGDHEFITSDNPVIMSNMDGSKIIPFDKDNFIRLPIDNKHQVIISPKSISGSKEENNVILRRFDNENISSMESMILNTQEYDNALTYIIGNESGVNGYLRNKPLYERTVTPKELEDDKKALIKLKELLEPLKFDKELLEAIEKFFGKF